MGATDQILYWKNGLSAVVGEESSNVALAKSGAKQVLIVGMPLYARIPDGA